MKTEIAIPIQGTICVVALDFGRLSAAILRHFK
jgi:hypothetical protein